MLRTKGIMRTAMKTNIGDNQSFLTICRCTSSRQSAKMPLKQRKVAVMGSRSVGKSSLVIQFVQVAMIMAVRIINAIKYGIRSWS